MAPAGPAQGSSGVADHHLDSGRARRRTWAVVLGLLAFKASLATALAALVTPIVAMRTLEDGVQASGVRSIAGY